MQNPDGKSLEKPSRKNSASLAGRLQLREEFFRRQIDPVQLLQPLANLPGIRYFVKDRQSRFMAVSPESASRMGFHSEEGILGRSDRDFLPPELANKFLTDDQWVLRHAKPLRNIVEMWLNERGFREWIITDKYPLLDKRGKVVGLIGTIQNFAVRCKMLAQFGPVGSAADFIQEHLGESLMLAGIARHVGLSERQLQRLFRRAFGLTVQQFIIQSRVQGAIYELTNSRHSLAEIAAMFGFSDQSAFTNKIHAVTGLPPKAYRERYVAKFLQQ